MRVRLVAAVALLVVGLGAVSLVVLRPGAASSASQFLTAAAITTDVVDDVAATGTLSASATYGLAFGSEPQVVSSSASAASSGAGGGGSSWLVTSVSIRVGDHVTVGQPLAAADTTAAAQSLALAQADLASAQARLATDLAGPTAADKAAAYDQVRQAQLNLAQAKTNQANTRAQNDLKVAQAQGDVTAAQAKLDTDTAASAPADVLATDADALQRAQDALATTNVQVKASNDQVANQVASAALNVSSAQNTYATRIAGATDAQAAADRASVARAEATVADAQKTLDLTTITAPAEGVVVAVAVEPGVLAPSGMAIEIQTEPLQVTASVAESDRPKLKVGQEASITVTAVGQTVTGHVSAISPTASGGGQSSVVSYPVTIVLDQTPTDAAVGMTADASITIDQATGVVAVPTAAVITSADGASTVRVVGTDGQAQARSVEIGLVTRTYVEIKSGIAAGETVVVGTSSSRTGTTGQTGFPGGFTGGGGVIGNGGFGR